jgi:hypothetical protein
MPADRTCRLPSRQSRPLVEATCPGTDDERAQRTHTEEFYQVTNCSLEMATLNRELREWEKTYNSVRPR